MVHTHPDSRYVAGDAFSGPDIWLATEFYIDGRGIVVYAVTPNAGILRFDPITQTESTIYP